ncbi:MAG TPA: hypothetical protein VGF98_05400 [Candidatus Tumulicola sp.]|jgi:hypothetical protein
MKPESVARLRDAERAAARVLDHGCIEDLTEVERFLARPLREAETELREALESLGSLDPFLRRNVVLQAAEQTIGRCWEKVFANVALRFCARFSIYIDAVVAAEERFLAENGTEHPCRVKPRRIAAPRIVTPDVPHVTIDVGETESIVTRCLVQVERDLREAIAAEVEDARRHLMDRAILNLARTHIATLLGA